MNIVNFTISSLLHYIFHKSSNNTQTSSSKEEATQNQSAALYITSDSKETPQLYTCILV